jgi:DNA-binding CsgD family transcriptional regulator
VDDHPALVIFEDLHWADGGSLEILGRLARGQDPLLLVATFRPVELEVVRLVARGYTNGQIADRLFVTTKTVSTHVSNACRRRGSNVALSSVPGPYGRVSPTTDDRREVPTDPARWRPLRSSEDPNP